MVFQTQLNDISNLRSVLENHDRTLLSTSAHSGTPETALDLISRMPPTVNISCDDSAGPLASSAETAYLNTHIPNPSPTHHALLYLLRESARSGNVAVFRAHPEFLATKNRNIESRLVNAIEGGVGIWDVILSHDAR